ncbi:GNAT family N-acetyltransferase [Streptomyces parvus]|uniref:GNAT family N-acetyltransferase n=1 Tax=Streptomyces parvus TaxID=66428 RepID=UPI002100E81C|nr:GNAT family protein [Streptomyces parvus]MCQ1579711.1 GNAT family N-acetyltransferase [Streptomyces parvus]
MTENIRIADDEHDAEAERQLVWRAESVGLAALDIDDAELMHSWRSDPVAAHQIGIWPRSLTAVRERIERDVEDDDRDDFLILSPDSIPVGYVALTGENIVNGTAQVELLLAARHRGHGHGTAALDAVVDLAFGELPMYRLTAETHTDNTPALAVLAKSGFTQEGISRAACLHRGRRHDLAVFSLLRPEWEELTRPRAWDA